MRREEPPPLSSNIFAVQYDLEEASLKQMALETNEGVLRKTQLLARLTESEMRTLCARVSKRHFGRGEMLFSEGDQCHGLFVVAAGRIRIFKLSLDLSPFLRQPVKRQYPANGGTEHGIVSTKVHA